MFLEKDEKTERKGKVGCVCVSGNKGLDMMGCYCIADNHKYHDDGTWEELIMHACPQKGKA